MGAQLASRSRTSARAPQPEVETRSVAVDALWLGMLHRICGRAAHELRGVLNGVSVNLEVVRSRAGRADVPASAVITYATAASEQFDAVIAMTEALLALTRPAPDVVELATTVRHIEALLAPAARADGRQLELERVAFDALRPTSAPGSAVRLAIGACLFAALDVSAHVRCEPLLGRPEPGLRIENRDDARLRVDERVVAAVADCGIRIQTEPSAVSISFPCSPSPSPSQSSSPQTPPPSGATEGSQRL